MIIMSLIHTIIINRTLHMREANGLKKSYSQGIIISNNEISPNIYQLIISGNFQGKPGQFYMLRGWSGLDPLLAITLSISDLQVGRITFLYEVKCKGSYSISTLKIGDILSILGPLGNGYEIYDDKKIALVSGGIGIASMLYLAKSLKVKPDLFFGFKKDIYLIDQFLTHGKNMYIATEEGTFGFKGNIIDIFQPESYDLVICSGSLKMMKALVHKCRGIIPVHMSIEKTMVCGIGACLGCNIDTIRGTERVCKEGPIFIGEEVLSWE